MSNATVEADERAQEVALDVSGMDCASCVAHVTRAATAMPGVRRADVNLARGRAVVAFDPGVVRPEQIAAAISDAGYPATPEAPEADALAAEEQRLLRQRRHAREWGRRAVAGIVLWLPVEVVHKVLAWTGHHDHGLGWLDWLSFATATVGILFIGGAFYRSAWRAARRGTSNMDTLISMGATVAYAYSLVAMIGTLLDRWAKPELYFMEATGLLGLVSLGHWLEARARDQAGSAIRELLNLAPAVAIRLDGEHPSRQVPVASLKTGDRVLIRPGDRVAVDGIVIDGHSDVDESMITGEPLPVLRKPGDEAIAGTVNQTGRLVIKATRVGSETALAQIVKLVETAQNSKPPVQRLADRVAAVFVPVVLGIGLVTGVGWYAYATSNGWAATDKWATIARSVCAVLIIACPCALGLAVPAALMVGTGRGAKRGILIRDIDALQHAERIAIVALDKTGTVTRGRPVVAEIALTDGVAEDELLRLAASAEQFSEHPLARAVTEKAAERGVRPVDPDSFEYEPGLGVVARVDGQTLLVGSEHLLRKHGATTGGANDGNGRHRSVVHVARREADGGVTRLGSLFIDDEIKPDSKAAIAELQRLGLKTVLVTGDNEAAARAIAKDVGIDDVRADVRPGQKAQVIHELRQGGVPVAMVGDGINDAPALAAADLGIAIGSGSDIAKETGGIVLVSGSLAGIPTALRLSRATMRTIRQNLFLAFVYNALMIPLAGVGLVTPMWAAGAMALSDVSVIGNALLLRRARID
jgi:Cu+-exporting ATPase